MQGEGVVCMLLYIFANTVLCSALWRCFREQRAVKSPLVSGTVTASGCVRQGRWAVQGQGIPSDGLNRMSACYCPGFSLFCSPSWFNSDLTQIFFFLRDTEITWGRLTRVRYPPQGKSTSGSTGQGKAELTSCSGVFLMYTGYTDVITRDTFSLYSGI